MWKICSWDSQDNGEKTRRIKDSVLNFKQNMKAKIQKQVEPQKLSQVLRNYLVGLKKKFWLLELCFTFYLFFSSRPVSLVTLNPAWN